MRFSHISSRLAGGTTLVVVVTLALATCAGGTQQHRVGQDKRPGHHSSHKKTHAKSVSGKTGNGFPFVVKAKSLTTVTEEYPTTFGSRAVIAPPGQEFIQIKASISNPLSDRPLPLVDVLGGGGGWGQTGFGTTSWGGNFMLQVPTADDPTASRNLCPNGRSKGIDPPSGACFLAADPFGSDKSFLGTSLDNEGEGTTLTVRARGSKTVTFLAGPVLSRTPLSDLVFYIQFDSSACQNHITGTANCDAPLASYFTALKIPLPKPSRA
jgi:hypothetical protein